MTTIRDKQHPLHRKLLKLFCSCCILIIKAIVLHRTEIRQKIMIKSKYVFHYKFRHFNTLHNTKNGEKLA
jgi:hypothetical protein